MEAKATASSSFAAVAEAAGLGSVAPAAAVDRIARIVPAVGAAAVEGSTHHQVDRANRGTGLVHSDIAGTSEGEGAVVEEEGPDRTRLEEREKLPRRTCLAEDVLVQA